MMRNVCSENNSYPMVIYIGSGHDFKAGRAITWTRNETDRNKS